MDVCESNQKQSTLEKKRLPLIPAENKNKNGATCPHTRGVSSRYRSPTPPNPTRLSSSSTPTVLVSKRATSAERRRPSSPSPSTPVQDTSAEMILASRKTSGNKLPESLWPSTMRSLSVSFQPNCYSIPISKWEKPASHSPSKGLLASRKPTPERKRSPLKGKNSCDRLENSKPIESLHSRMVDQIRWPSTALNRSVDLGSKAVRISSGAPSLRRSSLDGRASKPLFKSTSDLLMQISRDDSSSSSSDRTQLGNAAARALSNPSRVKPIINPSFRGSSPARGRQSSPSRQPQGSTSVLSFIANIKIGKKATNHIEEVHQLRMLYNRHLQWRYSNARTCSMLKYQKAKAEKMLYNVWIVVVDLWDTVMERRNELQELRLKLKLYSVLNNQLTCLDEWTSIERDYVNSLTWAIHDLQASTIRVPVIGGARGDVEHVKAAISSAVDALQAMGSSLFSILARVEGMNSLVSELADVAAQEKGMLDECESVLGSTSAMQVDEYCLRTHLLQTKQASRNDGPSIYSY